MSPTLSRVPCRMLAALAAAFAASACNSPTEGLYDDTVCNNFSYIPPEEFLGPQLADLKLRRMLFNILIRERLMYCFSGGISSLRVLWRSPIAHHPRFSTTGM